MGNVKEVVIFHFSPIEIYPPIINLGNYLSERHNLDIRYTIITTEPKNTLQKIEYQNIEIRRYKGIDPRSKALVKISRYFNIYGSTFLFLLKVRPQVVIYFETLSSLPMILYKILFRRVSLIIHYHEIVTLEMLRNGRTLNKLLNKIEQRFYSKADWISQTNQERLNIFKEQYNLKLKQGVLRVMPNYPPERWIGIKPLTLNTNLVRMVHIGSLSFNSLFLYELLSFFGNKKGYQIDFFSHSINPNILMEFQKYNNIEFKGGIDYVNIPTLKGKYDVGLVLYKGNSLNFTYNAPNKIFEYLALDFDVWCSDKLLTAKKYRNSKTFPKLLMVDFVDLGHFDALAALNRVGLSYKRSSYFCEPIYKTIHDLIIAPFGT